MMNATKARRAVLRTSGRLAFLLSGGGFLLLQGCQSPPPQPRGFSPAQVAALTELGFVEFDQGWERSLSGKVLFGFASDTLNVEAVETIARIASTLLKVGLDRIRVEGHTDSVGEAQLNQRLSERRAAVVAREFATGGLPRDNIATGGYGLTRPIADNTTDEGRAQNRRVVIIVPSV